MQSQSDTDIVQMTMPESSPSQTGLSIYICESLFQQRWFAPANMCVWLDTFPVSEIVWKMFLNYL